MNYSGSKKETSANASGDEIEFAENFVNAAREMHLSENPNPSRKGCFTNEQIRTMTNSHKLPDDSVMNHLFGCSECFADYRQALELAKKSSEKKSVKEKSRFGWRNIFGWSAARTVLAGAGLAVLIAAGFFIVWTFQTKPELELAKNTEVSNDTANFGNSDIFPKSNNSANIRILENENGKQPASKEKQSEENVEKQSNKEINNQKSSKILPIEKRPQATEKSKNDSVNLILSETDTLRNTNDSTQENTKKKAIVLPAKRIDLNIAFNKKLSGNLFQVSVIDAFGNTLLKRKTFVKNKKLLLPNLNLQDLKNRADKLCLQKSGEIPACFNLEINE